MAITPKQASEARRYYEPDVVAAEAEIDELLSLKHSEGYPILWLCRLKTNDAAEIRRRYTAAGWSVSSYSDPRSDLYLKFRPAAQDP